jgi:cytoskeletal protein CcmA (bactofilin family)
VFTPDTGTVGTVITVTGYKWPIGETISVGNVTIGGAIATHSLIVNSKGEISGDMTCPSIAAGAQDVVITGTIAGAMTYAGAFTVIP